MDLRMYRALCTWIISSSEKIGQRKGWQRPATAFAFGVLSALAFPPLNFTPLLWVCFPALIFLLRTSTTIQNAFFIGWSYSFGFFLLGLYWIADAMFVDIEHFWWAVPLAVAGLPLIFAFYYGMAAALAKRFGLQDLAGIIAFSLLWFLADYARGHCFTGFPWILVGHTWSANLPILQSVSFAGIYGLTLITILIASLPALLTDPRPLHARMVSGGLLLLAVLALFGEARLQEINPSHEAAVPDVRLRLVQPNTDQVNKWDLAQRASNFQHLLDLTSAPAEKPVTHIIWPETAATFYLMEDEEHRQIIAKNLPLDGSLITGVIRREADQQHRLHYYNSLIALNAKAQVLADYDKFHLVPFGEYIPFRHILPLRALANMGLDFSTGDGVHSLRVLGLPSFSPLICYEAIFPGEVADSKDRPHFLLNITNDGWYGNTAGPYQHFALVRLRAIEEGLPLVRVANTGISGVIDAYGRIQSILGVGVRGFIDVDLPQSLIPTWYSRHGEMVLWLLFGALAFCVIMGRSFVSKCARRA